MLCFWTFLNASNNRFSSHRSQMSPTHHSANTFLMMIDRASTLLISIDVAYDIILIISIIFFFVLILKLMV